MQLSLRSLHVRHYKSLDDVKVEFSNSVTVLVGPNAAGKSNLVDCLRFVRDAVSTDLEHAIGKRGGIARVRQYSRTKPYNVIFALTFDQKFEHHPPEVSGYEFAIQSLSGGNFVVEHERAISQLEGWPADSKEDSDETDTVLINTGFERDKSGYIQSDQKVPIEKPVRPDQLALGSSPFTEGWGEPIAEFVKHWRYSALYPNTLRALSVPEKDAVLTEEGTNWASVIKALKRTQRGRAAFDRITEAMRAVLPSFRDVSVSTVGSYLVPRFRFENQTEFDPVQLSDGTLRVFGILLALYQVPPPPLLVIEEPEQTVHPGVLSVLADAFREVSETTQVVITTHSPHFVDHFSPNEVRVVSLVDGFTRVSSIKASQVEAVKKNLMSLEEFMLAEGLQPAEA